MITREEFQSKCKNIISEEDKAEIEKTKRKNKAANIVVILVGIILGIILAFINPYSLIGVVIATLISFLIVSAVYSNKWSKLKEKYASTIIDILLEDHPHTFNHRGFIESSIFRNSCFYEYYDDYRGSDLLTIDIPKDDNSPSGVNLSVCDLKTTKEVTTYDSEGKPKKNTETVYCGVFGYAKFPFNFKCDLVLNGRMSGTSRFRVEDINFNKTFASYSNNQLEALVILTPTLITKLIDFSKNVKGFKLALTQDGRLFFGMNRDLFELKASQKNLDAIFDRFYDDINNILAIVNEIKNNNKVFKM